MPTEVRAGTTAVQTTLVGTSAGYKDVQRTPVAYGRFITDADELGRAHVGVLGHLVAKDLFGENPAALASAMGKTLDINGQTLGIVGILKENGGPFSTDQRVFAPVSSVRLRLVGDLDLPAAARR